MTHILYNVSSHFIPTLVGQNETTATLSFSFMEAKVFNVALRFLSYICFDLLERSDGQKTPLNI